MFVEDISVLYDVDSMRSVQVTQTGVTLHDVQRLVTHRTSVGLAGVRDTVLIVKRWWQGYVLLLRRRLDGKMQVSRRLFPKALREML